MLAEIDKGLALLVGQFGSVDQLKEATQSLRNRKGHTARFVQSIEGLGRRFPGTKVHYFDPLDFYPPFVDLTKVTKPFEVPQQDQDKVEFYAVCFDGEPDKHGNPTRLYRGLEVYDPTTQRMINLFNVRLFITYDYFADGRYLRRARTISRMCVQEKRANDEEVLFGSRLVNRLAMEMDVRYSDVPITESNFR